MRRRPFDADRDGFVMGEGAALLVLEAEDVARGPRRTPYAEVMGYGATSDAHHMVQPRADGREAGAGGHASRSRTPRVAPDEIDWVSAHASSTPARRHRGGPGDRAALGDRAATVPVSGTKAPDRPPARRVRGDRGGDRRARRSATAGCPASVNLVAPEPELAALLPGLLREGREGRYRRVLSTSFGFGGLNAALVFGATGS